ncbi:alpha-amylase family glycosyl hydrolase [Saccharicrinis sp. GN24d3]|uniref:alpha-amylase family glycosyl hydrolase n=1 Tax=Saccharicrinis sp. GN24d3 TaxID=3458416 RepID=UPI0040373911
MRNWSILLLITWCTIFASAQVVTSDPTIPVESDAVTITFYADQGTGGLENFTGEVYAHTGVITDQSTSGSDWKYAPDWGDNDAKYKLTRTATNTYTLSITPNIRDYYGVPASEKIEQMAFVFRSGEEVDGAYKEGKDTGGKDIFVNVSEEILTVSISTPADNSVFESGADVEVKVDALLNENLELFVNGTSVASTSAQSLTHTVTNVSLDEYELRAVATKGAETVESSTKFYVRGEVVNETKPAGLRRGVNVIDANTVTVLLFAPDKEFVYLMGDFNDWEPSNDALMKKDGDYFWLTLDGLNIETEYAYQFWFDEGLKVADPYTNKVLDPWNDQYIPESVYPSLKAYPDDKTEEIVSVFATADQSYNWQVEDFEVPEPEKLVIYELHVRDWSENGDIKTVTDSIDYFKRLGVTAIELMPFNEFEGNDSWGYNPSFYFAPDKAYGTAEDYKEFIDVCHQSGIAVLMDMVLNHSFGQSPFARMYLDGGLPADNNPWYNREHNLEIPDAHWGYDFNHESAETKILVDSINEFWLKEYKIDGFRFDFTKGFSNTIFTIADDPWASKYDGARIANLKRMADEIWSVKSDAVVSFEHLSDNPEEKELAEYGILLWGNHNRTFNEATMGYNENNKSDFSWASYIERSWTKPHIVNYMESHDEERIMYKNLTYGASSGSYDVTELSTSLERTEAAAVFLMTIPGPKMIWQFGELGYDISIDENGRTGKKPIKWEYYEDENRKALYNTYSEIIDLKKNESVFSTEDFNMEVSASTKLIELNESGSDIRLVGNFDLIEKTVLPKFSSTGYWFNHFDGDSINVTGTNMTYTLQPGEFALFTQKKLDGFVPHVGIGDPTYFNNAWIAPNPVTAVLRIYSGDNPFERIKITSITGQLIIDKAINGREDSVDLSSYPTGIYLIHLIGDNNGYRAFKVIKH